MSAVASGDPAVDRLMNIARRVEREGKKETAELIYTAASEIARLRSLSHADLEKIAALGGFALVPIEATEEMIQRGTAAINYDDAQPEDARGDADYIDDVRRIYAAMIAATPKEG